MKTDCAHGPIYDLKTGGSKCKKCGVLLNDFNQEYSGVKESCNDSGGDSPLNTAHPPTSELISNLEAYAAIYENLKAEYETQSSTVKNLEAEIQRLKDLIWKAWNQAEDNVCLEHGMYDKDEFEDESERPVYKKKSQFKIENNL